MNKLLKYFLYTLISYTLLCNQGGNVLKLKKYDLNNQVNAFILSEYEYKKDDILVISREENDNFNKKIIKKQEIEYSSKELINIMEKIKDDTLKEIYKDNIICERCILYPNEKYYILDNSSKLETFDIVYGVKKSDMVVKFREKEYNSPILYEIEFNKTKFTILGNTTAYEDLNIKRLIIFLNQNNYILKMNDFNILSKVKEGHIETKTSSYIKVDKNLNKEGISF
ncbi:MAG: hypothetical protein LBV03_00085 [Fusobacteriales bacterium]|jgi:hypothetical protein|nr:hypothetical protein [Fusobacteriales bacterium]